MTIRRIGVRGHDWTTQGCQAYRDCGQDASHTIMWTFARRKMVKGYCLAHALLFARKHGLREPIRG